MIETASKLAHHSWYKIRTIWLRSSIKREVLTNKQQINKIKIMKRSIHHSFRMRIWLCHFHRWVRRLTFINSKVLKIFWKPSIGRQLKTLSGLIMFWFISGARQQQEIGLKITIEMKILIIWSLFFFQ